MQKDNSKGNIYIYLYWPIYFLIILIIIIGISTRFSIEMTIILSIFAILVFIVSSILIITRKTSFQNALMNIVASQSVILKDNLKSISFPMCICYRNGVILWANDAFLNLEKDIVVGQNISKYLSEVKKDIFDAKEFVNNTITGAIGGFKFKIHINLIKYNDLINDNGNKIFDYNDDAVIMMFENITELYDLKVSFEDEKLVIGLIYIDNYEEITDNYEDSKASLLSAMVDRKLTRYVSNNSGIIKKLDKDKYFFITSNRALKEMIREKFPILDQAKDILGNNNIPLTLSIGIGYDGGSIEKNYDLSGQAIDMALSRGGDQVVVKTAKKVIFFGGKTSSVDSNQRVRSRVKADSLKELFDSKDKVFIIGHSNEDLDSFGSSIGIYLMAISKGKEAHIVHNTITEAVYELKQKFIDSNDYKEDMFISGDQAIAMVNNDNSLLVLVDHNTKLLSDEKRLFERDIPIVIIDHHRVQSSTITDSIMSYIEVGASSVCEMTCELISFFDDNIKLTPLEAESLLAGIMTDTLNFTYRVSPKTYDAASRLRKRGADINRVRKLLRLGKDNEIIKNDVISKTEFYLDSFAIAYITNINEIKEISVLASQIANELINIKGVKASIVIYENKKGFSLSSRSIDEANVQVLMEKLGGGGHATQAGAIVELENIEQVISKLKEAINEMIENKEIVL